MSYDWNKKKEEMGVLPQDGAETPYLQLKEGSRPEVVIFEESGMVDCTEKELDTVYSNGGKICNKEGKVMEYKFISVLDGKPRHLRNSAVWIIIGMQNANVEPGDTIKMTRTGNMKETRLIVEKLGEKEVKQWKKQREKELAEAEATLNPEPAKYEGADADKEVRIEDIPF
ncbi:MAG: hypothetical protein WCX95_05085 [Candidatus Gracilibacteria bacterium]